MENAIELMRTLRPERSFSQGDLCLSQRNFSAPTPNMTIHQLSAIVTLSLASWASGAVHASVIANETHPVFDRQMDRELVEVDTAVTDVQPTLAPVGRVRSAGALEPARVFGGGGGGGERSSFFNEFINSTLGPLGKSELANSIQAISATLKPYLESQGAYSAPSSSRELSRLTGDRVVLAQEFSYAGVLTPVKSEVRTQGVEERTHNIDTMMVERGNSSQANPIMQGVIDFFSRLLKNLVNLFAD